MTLYKDAEKLVIYREIENVIVFAEQRQIRRNIVKINRIED